jgi:hypothetical protein
MLNASDTIDYLYAVKLRPVVPYAENAISCAIGDCGPYRGTEPCVAHGKLIIRDAAQPIRDPLPEGFRHFVASMPAPVASGWSDLAGWALHPPESAAFSRLTPKYVIRRHAGMHGKHDMLGGRRIAACRRAPLAQGQKVPRRPTFTFN